MRPPTAESSSNPLHDGSCRRVRKALSWSCYWAGEAVWRVFDNRALSWLPGWYRAYSRLMILSCDFQGDDDALGPWRDAELDDEVPSYGQSTQVNCEGGQ